MKRYESKVVMVIGCAQGIGKAVAEGFAKEGAHLAMFDIQDKVHETGKLIKEQSGVKVHSGIVDISSFESCEGAAKETIDVFGRIDVLAIVSGILPAEGTVAETPVEMWNNVINVNLNGYFYMSKAIIPHMVKQKSGNIIMTGSWWGYAGRAYFASYCCSKAAVMKLTHALAEELAGDGIRVNCICPGSIATELHLDAIRVEADKRGITIEEMKAIDYERMALKRAGYPSEIADAFVFLGTEQASYITGATIDVNGGGYFR